MPEQQEELQGGRLLAEISGAMVSIFRESMGKGPERCKTYWAGSDMLVVLLGGGFSVAEQTLFDSGRGQAVQESRMAIQAALEEQMTDKVEELSGRKVTAFLSASHQDPDLSAEVFVLEPLAADPDTFQRRATDEPGLV